MTDSITVTREQVEEVMRTWLEARTRRLIVMFADGMPKETERRRNSLARTATTALFNNVKAEKPHEFGIGTSLFPESSLPHVKVGEEGETMAIPVEVVKILMKNRHFYDCIPGQRGDDPSETECSFVCIALRTAFQANTHRGEAR